MSFQQLSAKVREVYLSTRAEIEGKDAEIAALKKVGEQRAAILEKAVAKRHSDAQTISNLTAEVAALKEGAPNVLALEAKVAELQAKVAELQERDARVKLFVDKLMGDKANLEGQVECLIDTTADLATHNEDLATDFDDMEARASRFEDDNTELVASIKVLESIVTAREDDLDQWKAAHAHCADRLAETEAYLQQADEMNADKDAEIEELHGKGAYTALTYHEQDALSDEPDAPTDEPDAPTDEPASKKRRRGEGSLRREFTYDHVSIADGKLVFKIADAEHPATDAKLRYVDVITATGRSYNRYYVVRDGKEKMCRSKADVERAFGVTPSRKYVRSSVV